MLCRLHVVSVILSFEVEQVGRPYVLARKLAKGQSDRHNAPASRVHSPEPDSQQVLTAVTRLSRQVRRLDPSGPQEPLQSCSHVQYVAL